MTDVQLLLVSLHDILVPSEFPVAADGGPGAVGEGKDEDDDVEELEDAASGCATRLEAGDADVLDDDGEHAEEEAAHNRVEVVLQVTQVLRVEHLAQRVYQLTQVEVVRCTSKGRKHTDQADQLTTNQVSLRN